MEEEYFIEGQAIRTPQGVDPIMGGLKTKLILAVGASQSAMKNVKAGYILKEAANEIIVEAATSDVPPK